MKLKPSLKDIDFISSIKGKYTPIRFSTLLIRAEVIFDHRNPKILSFLSDSGFNWLHNNHLIYTYEMNSHASELSVLINKLEKAFGLEYDHDLVILNEQLIYGVGDRITPLIWKPIPGTEKLDWLSSKIMKTGNMVWRNKHQVKY